MFVGHALVMTEVGAALFGGSNLLSMGGLGNCLRMEKAKDLTQHTEKGGEKPEADGGSFPSTG
jgi:hypothetical protein